MANVEVRDSNVVAFTLTIARTGATLFDVVIEDPLDAYWVLVPGSASTAEPGIAVTEVGNTIRATAASYASAGFTITYLARLSDLVDTTLSTGTRVNNTATLTWNGQASEPTSQITREATDYVIALVVNDPPTITEPSGQPIVIPEDTSTALPSIVIDDVDVYTGEVKVTLVAADVTMTMGTSTGLAFISGGPSGVGKTIEFTATLANANAALASIDILGDLNFNGLTTITVNVNDQGNTGSGGAQSATPAVVDISVTAINDAPVLSVPAPTSIDEDATTALPGISVADVDVNEGTGIVNVTLSSADLTLDLAVTTGLTFAVGGPSGSGKTLVFTGALAAVNTALASLDVLPDSNFEGSTSIVVTVDDQGNTGTGGTLGTL